MREYRLNYGNGQVMDLGACTERTAQQALLTDPQTSGGLLVACDADSVEQVLAIFYAHGFQEAAVVGEMMNGEAEVTVLP